MTRIVRGDGPEPPEWPDPDPDHVLTGRQQKMLQVIREYGKHRGYAPSLREIAEAAGLASTSSVSYQLSVLQDKGYLRRDARRPRTVEVHRAHIMEKLGAKNSTELGHIVRADRS